MQSTQVAPALMRPKTIFFPHAAEWTGRVKTTIQFKSDVRIIFNASLYKTNTHTHYPGSRRLVGGKIHRSRASAYEDHIDDSAEPSPALYHSRSHCVLLPGYPV